MGETVADEAINTSLPQEANAKGVSLEKLYDSYTQAKDLAEIMKSFLELKTRLELTNLQGIELYREFRAKLKIRKAGELFDLLDKRAKQKEYKQQSAAKGKRVLIVGSDPVGLRTAVDCVLLGCDVVVVEKRNAFTRNNVLHLWPFTIEDLRQLGATKLGKPHMGVIDHVSSCTLQCILLKICLLFGVTIYTEVEFVKILEPDQSLGWHASFKPTEHRVNQFDFDVLVGTDGKKSCIPGFDRKELRVRGKLALAITANFVNYYSKEEAACDEIRDVAFIFNQKFFKDLKQDTGIDLENIVYYRDDTHYFVMTAKKESLLEKKVIRADYPDTQQLLNRSNVDHEKLCQYAYEAAEWSTGLPRLDFAQNHYNMEDVILFNSTSIHAAECSARAIRRNGKDLIMCLAGDSLLEPLWPIGTGCARGFLSAMDTAWMVQGLGQGKPIVELLCERESIYQRLPQTTPEKLHQSIKAYTIDPMSRYPNLNTQVVKPADVAWLYDTGNEPLLRELPAQQRNMSKRLSNSLIAWKSKSSKKCKDEEEVKAQNERTKKEASPPSFQGKPPLKPAILQPKATSTKDTPIIKAAFPKESHNAPFTLDSTLQPQPQRLKPATNVPTRNVLTPFQPVIREMEGVVLATLKLPKNPPHNASSSSSSSSSVVQLAQPHATIQQQPPMNQVNQTPVHELKDVIKPGQHFSGTKLSQPAQPLPIAVPKEPQKVKEVGPAQASSRMPQKPAPYRSSSQRSSGLPIRGPVVPVLPLATLPTPIIQEKQVAKPAIVQEAVACTHSSPSLPYTPQSSPALKDEKTLLKWLQDQLKDYKLDIKNLTDFWKDGIGLCALIHHYHPELIPQYSQLSPKNPLENNTLALSIAKDNFGFNRLVTPEEFSKPDKLAMFNYLSFYYEIFSTKEPVLLKKKTSTSFWSRLSCKKKKSVNIAERPTPAVKWGWIRTTVQNQSKPSGSLSPTSSKPSGSLSPTSSLSAPGTKKESSPELWRSPSPAKAEPFSGMPNNCKEASHQADVARTNGKAKTESWRNGRNWRKSIKKGKDVSKEEDVKSQDEGTKGTKKEASPPSSQRKPSLKPATQQYQALEMVKEAGSTQESPKMPQKPAPYVLSSQHRSVAHLLNRDDEGCEVVVGSKSRAGSGLPPKSTILSPTKDFPKENYCTLVDSIQQRLENMKHLIEGIEDMLDPLSGFALIGHKSDRRQSGGGDDFENVSGDLLGVDDLADVMDKVMDVTSQWKNLGMALGIKDAVINTIFLKSLADPTECLREMLLAWLQQRYDIKKFGLPSWRMLCQAISKAAGGNNPALARKIAHCHLPVSGVL